MEYGLTNVEVFFEGLGLFLFLRPLYIFKSKEQF